MERVYHTVGERVGAARRASADRLTQGELARRTDPPLSRSAIANIESGRQRLAVHQLYLIAEALGIEPSSLLPPAGQFFARAQTETVDQEGRDFLAKVVKNQRKEGR